MKRGDPAAILAVVSTSKRVLRDPKLVERTVRHGLKGLSVRDLKPGPATAISIAVNWHQRTVRIRNDGRRNKKWRYARDRVLRELVPGPIKGIARLFKRRRRRRRR